MERVEKRAVQDDVHETGLVAHVSTLQTESDLTDNQATTDALGAHEDAPDYHTFSKQQLLQAVKKLANEPDAVKAERELREIKSAFDELCEQERTHAFNRFILDGGTPDSFDYRGEPIDAQFAQLFRQIKERKTQQLREEEIRRNENYKKKLELLERLRHLVDSQDVNVNQFEQFKALQSEWKSIGAVPGVHSKTLWANYHALVDRFYDNQSIYFELKELDRKKNLEAKIELCQRAERLLTLENIQQALRELNELHHEFKHIGPVPREEKEAVWQRFKAASDALYARRDAYNKQVQEKLQENLHIKTGLSEQVQEFAAFQTERIKEWNQKTKAILELQKQWQQVGPMPRNKGKEVSKKFWSAFKTFFNNKNAFLRKLDIERKENLKKKQELVQRAKDLRESQEWDATASEFRKLQQQWKEIGPVPDKHREKIFAEFKGHCDYFFERLRNSKSEHENQLAANLKAKEEILNRMEQAIADGQVNAELLSELKNAFESAGEVPRSASGNLRTRFRQAFENLVQAIPDLPEEEKNRLILENEIGELKSGPDAEKKLQQKEQAIRKKIAKVENDITLWKNNLEFFARSKNADSLREEVNRKIETASERLARLKQQLKMLRTVA
ncbi:MAG: DUF349 domain-containing protein [Cyclobacteriaceae bacterium]|nr:DUF349 domain-containing protein [Cyclobacteriaceae bacterium]